MLGSHWIKYFLDQSDSYCKIVSYFGFFKELCAEDWVRCVDYAEIHRLLNGGRRVNFFSTFILGLELLVQVGYIGKLMSWGLWYRLLCFPGTKPSAQ